jgi:hypothetical protein
MSGWGWWKRGLPASGKRSGEIRMSPSLSPGIRIDTGANGFRGLNEGKFVKPIGKNEMTQIPFHLGKSLPLQGEDQWRQPF